MAEFYNPEAIRKKSLRQRIIKLSGTSIELTTQLEHIKQVRIVPKSCHKGKNFYKKHTQT